MRDAELVDQVRGRVVARGRSGAAVPGSDESLGALLRDDLGVLADERALEELGRGVRSELSGAGPLDALLALPGTTDVLVNGPDDVWLDRGRGLERSGLAFPDEAAVRRLARRLAATAGRRLDDSVPFVDACLADGTRLHAVIPPICPHTTISLRVLGRRRFDLSELADPPVVELLTAIVRARLAFLITGGTGTGKTTLLSAMLGRVEPSERLLVIEDARELVIPHPHVVRLACRVANVEGSGVIGLSELVRQSLRMRPDRIVVGEFRGAELAELLGALNTGHEGGAATMHANSAADVPSRLAALGTLAALAPAAIHAQAQSALDVVVHLRRVGSQRAVEAVALLGPASTGCAVVPVWSVGAAGPPGVLDPVGGATLARLIRRRGVPVPAVLR